MPSKEEGSSVALAQKFKLQVPSKNVRDISNIRIHSPACGWWYVTLQHVHGGLGSLSKSFYLHDYNSPELQAARRWSKKGFGRGGPTHPHTIFSSEMVYVLPPLLPCSTGKPARGVICPPGKPPATNRTLSMERTKHQMNSNESKVYNALQCTHNWTQLAMT